MRTLRSDESVTRPSRGRRRATAQPLDARAGLPSGRRWRNHDDPQPTEFPAPYRTDPLQTAALEVGSVGWQLRLAVVSVTDRERLGHGSRTT